MYEDYGLDQRALAIYRAILIHHEHDPGQLAERLGLEKAEVASVIERLTKLSLLAPSWERPGTFRAVSPRAGLEMLLRHEQTELARRQQRIEESRTALASVAAEYAEQSHSSGGEGMEELSGVDQIRTRLEELAEKCEREVLAFHPSVLTAESVEAGRPLNERAMERGVRFRTIHLDSANKDRVTVSHAEWMAARGGEVRTTPTLPMRLLIVDSDTAIVAGLPNQPQPGAIVISRPPVVLAMRALFEAYWEQAEPLGAPAPTETGLTKQEERVLLLLASGLTDDAVARALGIGVRSERRIVSELMTRLDANSRFQAGVKAARLNWI